MWTDDLYEINKTQMKKVIFLFVKIFFLIIKYKKVHFVYNMLFCYDYN